MSDVYYKRPGLSLREATEHLGRNWIWLLIAGIALLILGIVALSAPLASTLGVTFALAGLFTASGVIQLIHAFGLREHQGGLTRFLHALLALALGVFMLWLPQVGMLTIGLLLSFYFLISAVIHFMFAQAIEPLSARIWVYINSAISFALGMYIVLTYPLSALWVPGVLLGVEFVMTGFGLAGLSLSVRKLYREKHGASLDRGSPVGWQQPSGHTT